MLPRSSYFICAAPRSGSWLLAGGLEDTRIAGHPSEWFNEPEEKVWCRRWGIPYPIAHYEQYLDKVMEAGMGGTDIFGVKCLSQHFREISVKIKTIPKYRGMPMQKIMSLVFPNTHYIRLLRRDKIRQAISYCRASQTQLWWRMEGHEGREVSAPQPVYDPAAIARHEQMLNDLEAVWQEYFEVSAIVPLTLYYEDLVADYENTIRHVLAYIGVTDTQNIRVPPPRFKKQADAMTEDWAQRYADYAGRP